MSDWLYEYLNARGIRIYREDSRTYVYQNNLCLLNKNVYEKGIVQILEKEIDYNDLKAIMEVL